jgi:hypothetical protein
MDPDFFPCNRLKGTVVRRVISGGGRSIVRSDRGLGRGEGIMPLSESDQRRLDEIERACKGMTRSSRPGSPLDQIQRRRIVAAGVVVLLVVGLGPE